MKREIMIILVAAVALFLLLLQWNRYEIAMPRAVYATGMGPDFPIMLDRLTGRTWIMLDFTNGWTKLQTGGPLKGDE